jgi:hypothetical protein
MSRLGEVITERSVKMKTLYIYKLLDNGKIEKASIGDYTITEPNIHGKRSYKFKSLSFSYNFRVCETDLDTLKTQYLVSFSDDDEYIHRIILDEMTKRLHRVNAEVERVWNKKQHYEQIVMGLQKGDNHD